jgi:Uncharacterized conserved protein
VNTKENILSRIRANKQGNYEMPDYNLQFMQFEDKTAQFMEVISQVGGSAEELKKGEDLNALIRSLYPEAKTIASALPEITLATINPDTVATPYELNGTDLAVIQGEIGVAENGCVWIPQNVKERAVYFISEYLVILLNKERLVNTMHEAYKQIAFNDYGYGVFISGPSKTADIEQALVVGAHGARGVTVILT